MMLLSWPVMIKMSNRTMQPQPRLFLLVLAVGSVCLERRGRAGRRVPASFALDAVRAGASVCTGEALRFARGVSACWRFQGMRARCAPCPGSLRSLRRMTRSMPSMSRASCCKKSGSPPGMMGSGALNGSMLVPASLPTKRRFELMCLTCLAGACVPTGSSRPRRPRRNRGQRRSCACASRARMQRLPRLRCRRKTGPRGLCEFRTKS